MSDRVFLDTNLFVCSFDRSQPEKAAKAERMIRAALAAGNGVVSYQVVQEFFNVALRRFASPLAPLEAEQYLGTVFQPLLRVHSSVGLFNEALRIHNNHRLAWHDSLMVGAAMQAGCTVLYTEDLQHGQRFGSLRIVDPFL